MTALAARVRIESEVRFGMGTYYHSLAPIREVPEGLEQESALAGIDDWATGNMNLTSASAFNGLRFLGRFGTGYRREAKKRK